MRKKIIEKKILGGFFGNIFTKIAENIPEIALKVAPIALDAGKAFAVTAGTAVGQKITDKLKGANLQQLK